MTTAATTTDLSPTLQSAATLAKSDAASFNDLLVSLNDTGSLANQVVGEMPFPALPEPVVITPEIKKALLALPKVLGAVQPANRRVLDDGEVKSVYDEFVALKEVETFVAERRDALKVILRAHIDTQAEADGLAYPRATTDETTGDVHPATPRTADGNYLLTAKGKPVRVNVPGTDKAFSDEFRAGKPTVDAELLLDLHDADEISREEYLAFTREVRVFDADKARAAIKKDPSLIRVLARITRRTADGAAMYVRKQK